MAKCHRDTERQVFAAMGWRRTWKEDWDGEGEDADGVTWYGEVKSEAMKAGGRALCTVLERALAQINDALDRAADRAEEEGRHAVAQQYREAPRVAIYSPTHTAPRFSIAYTGGGRMWFLKEFVEQVCRTEWKGA